MPFDTLEIRFSVQKLLIGLIPDFASLIRRHGHGL
jgi:hypothetical protein